MLRRASVFLLILTGAGLLTYCGSASPPAGPGNPGGGGSVLITITGSDGAGAFAPANASVKVGQTVAWYNGDSATHRPILTDVFDTGQLASGETSTATLMTTANVYDYKCTMHPSETGIVSVTP
jgi:plastocyanin